jgi:hypothetical protein
MNGSVDLNETHTSIYVYKRIYKYSFQVILYAENYFPF